MSRNTYKAQHRAERRKDPAFLQKELARYMERYHEKKEDRMDAHNALSEDMRVLMNSKRRLIWKKSRDKKRLEKALDLEEIEG